MKIKGFFAVVALCMANIAQAGVTIHLQAVHGLDACGQIEGHWAGNGTVKKGPFISCDYSGVAVVKSVTPGNFMIDIDLHKDSGFCPSQESITLPGTCSNGVLRLQTDNANLDGTLNNTGTVADLRGRLLFLA